jgi:hypothetical protein
LLIVQDRAGERPGSAADRADDLLVEIIARWLLGAVFTATGTTILCVALAIWILARALRELALAIIWLVGLRAAENRSQYALDLAERLQGGRDA